MEIPNNNNPDEKADEMIILNAASEERLFPGQNWPMLLGE
jgi:hypothetical protein